MGSEMCIRDRFRIISRDDAEYSAGIMFAYNELIPLHTGERFCAIVPSGCLAVKDWDEQLKSEYAPGSMCTFEPMFHNIASASSDGLVSGNDMGSMAQNMMRMVTHSYAASSLPTPRSTYPVYTSFNGRFPLVGFRTLPTTSVREDPTRSIALGSVVFGPTKQIEKVLWHGRDLVMPHYAFNYALSALMFAHVNKTFTVCRPCFVRAYSPSMFRPHGWDSKSTARYFIDSHAEYNHFAGLDLSQGIVSGRAQMGLLLALRRRDIIAKFGSTRNFDRVKRQFS